MEQGVARSYGRIEVGLGHGLIASATPEQTEFDKALGERTGQLPAGSRFVGIDKGSRLGQVSGSDNRRIDNGSSRNDLPVVRTMAFLPELAPGGQPLTDGFDKLRVVAREANAIRYGQPTVAEQETDEVWIEWTVSVPVELHSPRKLHMPFRSAVRPEQIAADLSQGLHLRPVATLPGSTGSYLPEVVEVAFDNRSI
ncbi:MAG: hypothetical protein H0T69_12805 [Thermoleophilaceae bacterium]|nr:hypothetical protein [Thermoleophilaceae bacterium]